jgi:divalent metal cation (Fe/Co/Zn/Cd) transporter
MLVFGIIGLTGNVIGLAVLMRSRSANLNLRAAFLEVLNDALGSVAVIVAAIVIATTGWTRADAVVSLLIAVLIVPRTISLLRDVGRVLLESTPRGLDLDELRRHILQVPHVQAVHDLHASQIATCLPVLTAHVVVDAASMTATSPSCSTTCRPASRATSPSASNTPPSSSRRRATPNTKPPTTRHAGPVGAMTLATEPGERCGLSRRRGATTPRWLRRELIGARSEGPEC